MHLDCLPCICRQTLESIRMVSDDEKLHKMVLKKYSQLMPDAVEKEMSAPAFSAEIQAYVKEISGEEDPYKTVKENNLRSAAKILDLVKKEIKEAEDPFLASLLMAAMGNSIDAGVSLNVDIELNIERALEHSFKKSDYNIFLKELQKAEKLLFIADNTGEALFDKLLLQKLAERGLKITYAVREVPILNDITEEDALKMGIDQYADIIKSGSRAPGMLMERASKKFIKAYQEAEIVLSKGQGNLESLYREEENIYYLLKAKCQLIADILDVELGDFVFIYR